MKRTREDVQQGDCKRAKPENEDMDASHSVPPCGCSCEHLWTRLTLVEDPPADWVRCYCSYCGDWSTDGSQRCTVHVDPRMMVCQPAGNLPMCGDCREHNVGQPGRQSDIASSATAKKTSSDTTKGATSSTKDQGKRGQRSGSRLG